MTLENQMSLLLMHCALLAAPVVATCAHCKASTADICNQNGCGYLESGNGAPVVERQAALYRVLTPRITVEGEVTEWFPDYMLYNQDQLGAIVGPYKITERFYTSPPAPVAVVLPDYVDPERASSRHGAEIWNACLDKVKELNQ